MWKKHNSSTARSGLAFVTYSCDWNHVAIPTMNRNANSPLPHWGPDGTNAVASTSFTSSQPASGLSPWYVHYLRQRRLPRDIPCQWFRCYERSLIDATKTGQTVRINNHNIATYQPRCYVETGMNAGWELCRPRGNWRRKRMWDKKISSSRSYFDSGNSDLKGRKFSKRLNQWIYTLSNHFRWCQKQLRFHFDIVFDNATKSKMYFKSPRSRKLVCQRKQAELNPNMYANWF